ncbi:unnamed protein product, partial [Trichogramma brassicae]
MTDSQHLEVISLPKTREENRSLPGPSAANELKLSREAVQSLQEYLTSHQVDESPMRR